MRICKRIIFFHCAMAPELNIPQQLDGRALPDDCLPSLGLSFVSGAVKHLSGEGRERYHTQSPQCEYCNVPLQDNVNVDSKSYILTPMCPVPRGFDQKTQEHCNNDDDRCYA